MAQTRHNLVISVPVLLVDEQMPHLKDTELRVLLVVLRQTSVHGRETGVTWLTHREMCRRTGRASEAVSAAVDVLVRKGMLRVLDESSTALTTTSERRARTGRRFYKVLPLPTIQERHGVAGKAKTIEENKNTYSLRKTDTQPTVPLMNLRSEESTRIEQVKTHIRERLLRIRN